MKKFRDVLRYNLKRLRKERKLTAKDIADVLYIEPNSVYKLESGTHAITPEYIDALCQRYKLDHDYFLFDPDKADPKHEDMPPELLFGIKKVNDLPLEARRSVIDYISYLIEKSEKEQEKKQEPLKIAHKNSS